MQKNFTPNIAWLTGFFVGLAMCLPTFIPFHPLPIPTFYNEWLASVLWFLVVVFGMATTLKRGAMRIPKVVGVLGILMLAIVVSAVINQDTSIVLWSRYFVVILGLLLSCCVVVVGGNCCFDRTDLQSLSLTLFAVLSIAGFVTVVILWLQIMNWDEQFYPWVSTMVTSSFVRPWANLNQPNHVANFLALCLLASSLALTTNQRAVIRFVLILNSVVMLAGMSWCGSRVVWLYLIWIVILLWLFSVSNGRGSAQIDSKQKDWRGHRWVCFGIIPIYTFFFYFNEISLGVMGGLGVKETMPYMSVYRPESVLAVGLREPLWRQAWLMATQHPWGVGFLQFPQGQFDVIERIAIVSEPADNAHNFVLDLMAKIGIPITLILLLYGFVWGWRVLRTLPKNAHHALYLFCIGLIGIELLHSGFEYPLHYLYFFLPFCWAVGYCDVKHWYWSMSRYRLVYGFFGLMTIVCVLIFKDLILDYRFLLQYSGTQQVMDKLNSNPYFADRAVYAKLSNEAIPKPIEMTPQRYETVVMNLEKAMLYFPSDRVSLKLAFLYQLQGQTSAAQKLLNKLKWRTGNSSLAIGFNAVGQACAAYEVTYPHMTSFCQRIVRSTKAGVLVQ